MKVGDKILMVPQEEYNKMIDRLMWLDALERAGVDNWDGWEEAREIYQEWNQE